jgi:hypothetical protein
MDTVEHNFKINKNTCHKAGGSHTIAEGLLYTDLQPG